MYQFATYFGWKKDRKERISMKFRGYMKKRMAEVEGISLV